MDQRKLPTKQKNNIYKPEDFNLIDVTIFHLDKRSNLLEKIVSKKADIKNNYGFYRMSQFLNLARRSFNARKV